MAGNVLAWPACAADHEIASFSAISAQIGLRLRLRALHARANADGAEAVGLRDIMTTSGGQQASNGRSATLLLAEHQRRKNTNIFVLRRRIGGGW
jgi:hypothetical protein